MEERLSSSTCGMGSCRPLLEKPSDINKQNERVLFCFLFQRKAFHPIPEISPLKQRSPTFLAPGTGFVKDNFSTDRGGGMVSG